MSDEDRQKWEARYAVADDAPSVPSIHLTRLDSTLPKSGRALDIAGGAGRHAVWLGQHGLETTLVDISPRALAIACERASRVGVMLHTECRDLEMEALPGAWDVIVSFYYLQRTIWPAMRAALAPGGWLLFVQPTVRTLERHTRPPAGFLLAENEGRAVAEGLEIVEYQEGWLAEDRHEAVVLARRGN
jgi:2-polyprenyl-3-methyl-5-hydroxy-6-metoxy-1,4-benzoquinol methylase